ncbi:hypothetical protein PR048_010071 [Dryococelus australis]|uniref:Uncharacterized protein n=1 Tax=Dryococelus australis TaxID=614101 RepID=A0ABQ9I1T2_9NEOP|nr:hypothetical protein PR048_010071 [Dryococelus australis]
MRVIEVIMEQRRNEGAGETGDPRENPPTNGIVQHDSHMQKSGVTRPGIEPGSPWWSGWRVPRSMSLHACRWREKAGYAPVEGEKNALCQLAEGGVKELLTDTRKTDCPAEACSTPGQRTGKIGAAVAQRLAHSPPTKAIRVQSPTGSLPDPRMWESYWMMPLTGGFSRGTPVSPAPALQRLSILGLHFMSYSGTTGTYGSQLESLSLGGCCLALDAKNTVASHKCAKIWSGSSASMEQDVIVEGFFQSISMHGLVYRRLIADGDSSVHRTLIDAMPYGTTRQVEKGECRNHICRNYVGKVRGLCSNTKLGSYELRLALKDQLRKDILNSPFHVLGDHSKCSERQYCCDGLPKPGEVNLVNEMEKAELLKEYFAYQVFKGISSTNWGIEKESVAIAQFERENPGIVVKRSGIVVDEEYPFLGASPDGLIGVDQII